MESIHAYIHATTSGSWFSQKEKKNIGEGRADFTTQKTALFIATHKEMATIELYLLDKLYNITVFFRHILGVSNTTTNNIVMSNLTIRLSACKEHNLVTT